MPISDKELLFTSLAQAHWDTFAHETLAVIKRDNKLAPQVFISYAWPKLNIENDIQAWLLTLHERLSHLGVRVLFDIKSMTLGTNIDEFMQQGVTQSDTILIIGTETYLKRSNEPTNVQREVEHIRQKVAAKGTGCVIPILYRGQFHTALPALGTSGTPIQVLGTDCHDELLYHNNLPSLIESLFQLQGHPEYQTLKQGYLAKLKDIENHGLSEVAVADFAQRRAQKVRAALAMQQEAVNLMLERNAKGHPDYVARPIGTESASIKLLSNLKTKYSKYTHVPALFGEPMALEGQYINVQMLYQVLEEKKQLADDIKSKEDQAVETNKEFKDSRVTSFESIFSKKEPLEIKHLFAPAKTLLTEKQKTNEARADIPPNLVLLQGRAGIGKTTFVNFVTREWALGRLWQEYNWVFSLRFRDLRSGAFQLACDKKETWCLEDWIYQAHFASHMDKPTFQTLWTWLIEPDLGNKKVLFILDGYDETPNHHPCEQALSDLLTSDTPKILTSRPYGLSDLPKDRRELEIVGFVDENVEKYVALYFKDTKAKAQSIVTGLKATPTLWGSAHIPVTLNVICGVLESEKDISTTLSKLNTMSSLYETMEMSLLERAYRSIPGKETEHKIQLDALDAERKKQLLKEHYKPLRQYLSKLAFVAFSKQQLILTPKDLGDVLGSFNIPIAHFGIKTKELIDLGLLKKVVDEATHLDTNYEFLHLTFQEYYAGHHLLWSVEQNSGTVIDDFAKIKLDPKYQLVLWFVAGTIKDIKQFNFFMGALAAPQGGDMLGNVQLGLLIRCTAENWDLAQESGWTKVITKMLQKRIQALKERFKRGEIDHNYNNTPPAWVNMINLSSQTYQAQTGALDLYPDVLKTPNSFFSSNRETFAKFIEWLGFPSPTILNTLAKLLADKNNGVRRATVHAIGKLGATAATPAFLEQLTKLMEDRNADVRWSALDALGGLGAAATTPDILANLVKKLANKYSEEPEGAAEAIGRLGAKAATPEILAQFGKLLADSYTYKFKPFLEAIGKLGAAAATPDIIAMLAKLLKDKNWEVRNAAVEAIGNLGAVVATREFLMQIAKLLAESDADARKAAIGAIDKLGAAAATPEFLTLLANLLTDTNHDVRNAAVDAIGKLGAAAATQDILTLLVKLLDDSNENVREAAAWAIYSLGVTAAIPDILAQFPKLLDDSNENVREAALYAIGKLGTAGATSAVLAQFPKLMADSKKDVKEAALYAIGNLGAAAATQGILGMLAKLLVDSDPGVRKAAIVVIRMLRVVTATTDILVQLADSNKDEDRETLSVLCKLGVAAATPEFLAHLAKQLEDSNLDVRWAAIHAIGALGATAGTSEFLSQLARLIEEGNEDVRSAALYAIGNLGAAAATQDILALLAKLLVGNEESLRKSTLDAISKLGSAAATPDILALLTKLLVDSNEDVRTRALSAIGNLGAGVVTAKLLALLTKLLADSNESVLVTAADAIGKLGAAAVNKDILVQIAKLLKDSNEVIRQVAANAIGNLGLAAATPDILAQLSKLLDDSYNEVRLIARRVIGELCAAVATNEHLVVYSRWLINERCTAAHFLPNLVRNYLVRNALATLAETPLFPAVAVTLVSGAYFSGDTSFNIAHDASAATYHLRGFADKTPLHISITHAQAQWFIYWTPQIIQSLDEDTLGSKLAEIEKAGMKTSSQKSVAWFDQSSSSSSSRSVSVRSSSYPGFFQPKAYGLSNDAVLPEHEQDANCVLM